MNAICFHRVDANTKIGFGHLSRCKIIADELEKVNIKSVFLFRDTDSSIEKVLSDQDYVFKYLQTDDPVEIISYKKIFKAQNYLLIFDTDLEIYYKKEVQLKLIQANFKMLFFTFWDHYKYYAQIIVNQNPLSLTHQYNTADYTRKLLGPQYMIFDDQFINVTSPIKKYKFSDELNFFLSFGGTDSPDKTSTTINLLNKLDINIKECHIVIGALYQNEKKLNKILKNCRFKYHLYKQIGNISEIMKKSNIAICSGGLTLWELAVLNIPSAVISYSERENLTASFLDENGWTYHIGSIQHLNQTSLSEKILKFVNSGNLKKRTYKLKNIININGKQSIINELTSLLND